MKKHLPSQLMMKKVFIIVSVVVNMEVFLIFLTKIEKLTFGDAVRRLASKAGMSEYKFSKLDVGNWKKSKTV